MNMSQLFEPGQVVATNSVVELFDNQDVMKSCLFPLLDRHLSGDYGDLCAADVKVNAEALNPKTQSRIMSSYKILDGKETLWIITEADRSATTFMLPSDY